MRGSSHLIYRWQIINKFKNSNLIFLALGPEHQNKQIKVFIPHKLCRECGIWIKVIIPDLFSFTVINSKQEKIRIIGRDLKKIFEADKCEDNEYRNVPVKKEAVRVEALDELKR